MNALVKLFFILSLVAFSGCGNALSDTPAGRAAAEDAAKRTCINASVGNITDANFALMYSFVDLMREQDVGRPSAVLLSTSGCDTAFFFPSEVDCRRCWLAIIDAVY